MPLELTEQKIREHLTEPNKYIRYRAKIITIDDENTKMEAFIINQESFEEMQFHLVTVNDARLFSKSSKGRSFKEVLNKDSLGIEFTGNLGDAVAFLQNHKAISKHTEGILLKYLSDHKKIPSATSSLLSL